MRRTILIMTALLVFAVLPIYTVKVIQKTDYTDFSVYYRAAKRMQAGNWNEIYSLSDGASPLRYAPITLPLMRPLAEVPETPARVLWFYLQYCFFGLGFFFLFRALKLVRPRRRASQIPERASSGLVATCFGILFILRFCLDTFTIGQVSSLMFVGFTLSLYAWMRGKASLAGIGAFIPTVFKVGPGVLYGVFASSRPKAFRRALSGSALLFLILNVLTLAWLGSGPRFKTLWSDWVRIVLEDGNYYDASHYGSQSVKSALLRLARQGWFSSQSVTEFWLLAAAVGCAAVAAFWILRRPRSIRSRGLFFSLGIFLYLWFMPETFKYALTTLAIPATLVFLTLLDGSRIKSRLLHSVVLGFGFLTLSIPGKDIVGDRIFFALQYASIPLMATLLLGTSCLLLAWQDSAPSRAARWFKALLSPRVLGPWGADGGGFSERTEKSPCKVSLLLPIPFGPYGSCDLDVQRVERIIADATHFLAAEWPARFEIIVIPFGDRVSEFQPVIAHVRSLAKNQFRIRMTDSFSGYGRAAALREGFLASHGEIILVSHFEQPCELSFFKRAVAAIETGATDLVRANRRHPETRFKVPVSVLSLVYRRHRLGLRFNRLIRAILPVQTTDTHSGTFAMTRKMALEAFSLQSSADFLFDLEISLVARTQGFREAEFPVVLYLAQEKTFKRMIHETMSILIGLPVLAWRYHRGYYRHFSWKPGTLEITADDWGLSPSVNSGILELARMGLIRKISLLADSRFLTHGLNELKELRNRGTVRLGLHFNLTYGKNGARPAGVLLRWILPFQNRSALQDSVRREFALQLRKLETEGVRPVYLDGHHHIHLTPGILESLTDLLATSDIREIRLPYDPRLWLTGKWPLNLLSLRLKTVLSRKGFSSRPFYYPSTSDFMDQGFLRTKLSKTVAGTEVIIHPANSNDASVWEFPDSYVEGRVTEYRALKMLLASGQEQSRGI